MQYHGFTPSVCPTPKRTGQEKFGSKLISFLIQKWFSVYIDLADAFINFKKNMKTMGGGGCLLENPLIGQE